jgi:flavin-dependent dehydrogenase
MNPALAERSTHWTPLTQTFATAQLRFERPQPWSENIFRLGDAAGFIDPFAGDGITLALLSGKLAGARVAEFLAGESSLRAAGESYARDYREKLAPLFARTAWLRRILGAPRVVRAGAANALRIPGVTRMLVKGTRAKQMARVEKRRSE